jgi:hypothetical protein
MCSGFLNRRLLLRSTLGKRLWSRVMTHRKTHQTQFPSTISPTAVCVGVSRESRCLPGFRGVCNAVLSEASVDNAGDII